MKQGAGGSLPPVGLSIYFFVSSKTQEQGAGERIGCNMAGRMSTGCRTDRQHRQQEQGAGAGSTGAGAKRQKVAVSPTISDPHPSKKKSFPVRAGRRKTGI
jgi:hypothetical protein